MRTTRTLFAFLLLSAVGAWAQDPGNCVAHGQLNYTNTICPCTGSQTQLVTCQSNGQGNGCYDFYYTNFCGSSCGIGEASGCISGGPKLKILSLSGLLEREIKAEFAKGPRLAVATCGTGNGAFERWLGETSSARQVQALKGIGD